MSESVNEPVSAPPSEWLKVMLDEIARKRTEAELARAEDARREERRTLPAGADSSQADV